MVLNIILNGKGRLATRTYEGIWVITFNRQLIAYNQNGVVTDQQDIVEINGLKLIINGIILIKKFKSISRSSKS